MRRLVENVLKMLSQNVFGYLDYNSELANRWVTLVPCVFRVINTNTLMGTLKSFASEKVSTVLPFNPLTTTLISRSLIA